MEDFVESILAPTNKPDWLGNRYLDPASVDWQEINLQGLTQSQAFLSIGV